MQKMDEYDVKLREKLMVEYDKKMQNSKIIKDQLHEFKLSCIKRMQEEQLEGELIRRQVEEEQERERQREYERKMKQEEQKQTFKQANEDLKVLQVEEKKKDVEYQRKIDDYARKKEEMEKLRKDKEEQKFQEKQMTRQRLIDRQIEHLGQIKNREDEILNKQVAEAEEKANRLFEEQERKRMELKQAIEKSRQLQMDKRNAEKAREQQEQKEFTEFWKIRNEELAIAELQEKEEDRMRQEALKVYNKQQIDKRQRKVEDEFKKELDEQTKA